MGPWRSPALPAFLRLSPSPSASPCEVLPRLLQEGVEVILEVEPSDLQRLKPGIARRLDLLFDAGHLLSISWYWSKR